MTWIRWAAVGCCNAQSCSSSSSSSRRAVDASSQRSPIIRRSAVHRHLVSQSSLLLHASILKPDFHLNNNKRQQAARVWRGIATGRIAVEQGSFSRLQHSLYIYRRLLLDRFRRFCRIWYYTYMRKICRSNKTCIVLSLISIFYFSIHVIFSYSAFSLQECSIKSVSQTDKVWVKAHATQVNGYRDEQAKGSNFMLYTKSTVQFKWDGWCERSLRLKLHWFDLLWICCTE